MFVTLTTDLSYYNYIGYYPLSKAYLIEMTIWESMLLSSSGNWYYSNDIKFVLFLFTILVADIISSYTSGLLTRIKI
jgi:hypothetical protein